MGRYHTTRAQRMDMLGCLREKRRDERSSYKDHARQTSTRRSSSVLLGRMYASVVAYRRFLLHFNFSNSESGAARIKFVYTTFGGMFEIL